MARKSLNIKRTVFAISALALIIVMNIFPVYAVEREVDSATEVSSQVDNHHIDSNVTDYGVNEIEEYFEDKLSFENKDLARKNAGIIVKCIDEKIIHVKQVPEYGKESDAIIVLLLTDDALNKYIVEINHNYEVGKIYIINTVTRSGGHFSISTGRVLYENNEFNWAYVHSKIITPSNIIWAIVVLACLVGGIKILGSGLK